jgi:hypothetical protein
LSGIYHSECNEESPFLLSRQGDSYSTSLKNPRFGSGLRFAQGDNIKLITKITSLVILIAYDVLVTKHQI